jgi:hypothetical protein
MTCGVFPAFPVVTIDMVSPAGARKSTGLVHAVQAHAKTVAGLLHGTKVPYGIQPAMSNFENRNG